MRLPTTLALSIATALLAFAPSATKAQSCSPADTVLTPLHNDMKRLVVSTRPIDVATRQRLAIPTVDSSQVTVVTDTRICDKVLAPFKSSLEAGIPLPTKLFVMKVGTVYVALYPEASTEADIYRVLSNKYAVLSRFAK